MGDYLKIECVTSNRLKKMEDLLDDFHGFGDVEAERHDDVFTNVMRRRVFTIGIDEMDSSALIAAAG